MSSRISSLPQPKSRTSPGNSTTRLHFQNHRQSTSQYQVSVKQQTKSTFGLDDMSTFATEMHRQDSGYASTTSYDRQPRSPRATYRHGSSTTSDRLSSRQHPPIRRSTTSSSSIARLPKSSRLRSRAPLVHDTNLVSVTVTPPVYNHNYHEIGPYDNNHTKTTHTSYFQFPPLELQPAADDISPRPSSHDSVSYVNGYEFPADNSTVYQVPPQTTHYWTSDQTRRLEYAAIDAASRGFKGWVMRHMVPDCFVPKSKRRVTFDDDTGSVRRYRIALETEESTEKKCRSSVAERGFKKGGTSTW